MEFLLIICFAVCLTLFGMAVRCKDSVVTALSSVIICMMFVTLIFIPSKRIKQNIVKDYLRGNIEVQYQDIVTDSGRIISRDTIIVSKHKK